MHSKSVFVKENLVALVLFESGVFQCVSLFFSSKILFHMLCVAAFGYTYMYSVIVIPGSLNWIQITAVKCYHFC